MGILSKIRNRASGLVIGLTAFAIISFLVGDALNNRFSIFNQTNNAVANINGENIAPTDLEKLIQQAEMEYMVQSGQETVDPTMQPQLRQQAWDQLVQAYVYDKEYKKLGLTVTGDEVFDLVAGDNPHPGIVRAFTDPQTGQFQKEAVINFLKTKENDQTGKASMQWKVFEDRLIQERLNQKYNALIKNAVYVTKLEAQSSYEDKNKSLALEYIQLPYSSVADSLIKITDGDMADYYKSHRYKFKPVTERKAEYVVFDVTPSKEDSMKVYNELLALKEPFAASTDDTTFVAANNDSPFDTTYLSIEQINPTVVDQLVNGNVGTVVGPLLQANTYRLMKLTNVKNDTAPYVRASHIILPLGNDSVESLRKLNSFKEQIQAGTATFEDLARTNSTDGSAASGGDLGWFTDGKMIPEFYKAVVSGKKGDLKILRTMFGYHLIKITADKTYKRFQLAVIERGLDPLDATHAAFYNKALQFAADSRTREAFDASREKMGINALVADRIKEEDKEVPGLENSQEFVNWMYRAEVGEVSDVMEFGNKMVVAVLVDAKSKEAPKWQDFRADIEKEVRNQKKAEYLLEKLKDAEGLTTLADIAKKINATVSDAASVVFAYPNLPYIGEDREFVGAMFGMPKDKLTSPLVGSQGVYIAQVKGINEPAPLKDVAAIQATMSTEARSAGEFEAYTAVKTAASIRDYRYKFNLN